jgi:hypothetical protein
VQEHDVAAEGPNESSEGVDTADESSISEGYRQNNGPEISDGEEVDVLSPKPLLDPFELRSPIVSQSDESEGQTSYSHGSERLSAPEEIILLLFTQ